MDNTQKATVGIVGLGLIGGSYAKALQENGKYRVLAYDIDNSVLGFAKMTGAINGSLTDENLPECDYLLIALYPQATESYLNANAHRIKKSALVVDTVGTKQGICLFGRQLAKEHGFIFCGGHPMAGTQFSGFKYARASLFHNAVMILTPKPNEDLHVLDKLKAFFLDCGFARINITTPEKHDEVIAFTSQLAHVVSNAYIKSPTALMQRNFSAGSYKDLTRVARLNEEMWTQLFMENKDNLLFELDTIIANLQEYRDALADEDAPRLKALLRDGRIIKERTLNGERNPH